jgi:hypothetical protein
MICEVVEAMKTIGFIHYGDIRLAFVPSTDALMIAQFPTVLAFLKQTGCFIVTENSKTASRINYLIRVHSNYHPSLQSSRDMNANAHC